MSLSLFFIQIYLRKSIYFLYTLRTTTASFVDQEAQVAFTMDALAK